MISNSNIFFLCLPTRMTHSGMTKMEISMPNFFLKCSMASIDML